MVTGWVVLLRGTLASSSSYQTSGVPVQPASGLEDSSPLVIQHRFQPRKCTSDSNSYLKVQYLGPGGIYIETPLHNPFLWENNNSLGFLKSVFSNVSLNVLCS